MPWLAKNPRQLATQSFAKSNASTVAAAGLAQSTSIVTRAPFGLRCVSRMRAVVA